MVCVHFEKNPGFIRATSINDIQGIPTLLDLIYMSSTEFERGIYMYLLYAPPPLFKKRGVDFKLLIILEDRRIVNYDFCQQSNSQSKGIINHAHRFLCFYSSNIKYNWFSCTFHSLPHFSLYLCAVFHAFSLFPWHWRHPISTLHLWKGSRTQQESSTPNSCLITRLL